MNCKKCNFQNEETAKFCRNCGEELKVKKNDANVSGGLFSKWIKKYWLFFEKINSKQDKWMEANIKKTAAVGCILYTAIFICTIFIINTIRGNKTAENELWQQETVICDITAEVTHFYDDNHNILDDYLVRGDLVGLKLGKLDSRTVKFTKFDGDEYVYLKKGWIKKSDLKPRKIKTNK